MKNGWVNVENNIPEEVTPVLVYGECCEVCYHIKIAEIEDGVWFESGTGEDLKFRPTFWQHLPEPPNCI
jgi:hypothetical protein